jgi:hypothetical protein
MSIQSKLNDFIGKKIGKLTALEFSHMSKANSMQYWLFQCDCGNKIIKRRHHVEKSNGTTSCGCDSKQKLRIAHMKHGFFGTPIYNIWTHMIARCHYEFNDSYERYGARGIIVCEKWRESFMNFYSDMGDRPTPKHSIDRIDVNGNYCKENCRWATQKQQSNNKTNNFPVEYKGEIFTISQLSEKYSVDKRVLRGRILRGWTIEKSLFEPVRKIKKS